MQITITRRLALVAAAIAAGLLAGCGSAAAGPAATLSPGSGLLSRATLDAQRAGLLTVIPADALTDLEKAALSRGVATYTGYACVIAPIGCACETPIIQGAVFTSTPENRLYYDFTIQGSTPAQWQLDRAGLNQWTYTAPITSSQGQVATLLALLSFTDTGYILTQVATFASGEVVKCKNVSFHRLDPATAPTSTP